MKVIHVIVGLNTGGAETMLSRLVLASRAHMGWRHEVISLTDIGPVGQRLQAEGIPVQALGLASATGVVPALARLRRIIQDAGPCIVQTWMYHADLLGGLAARWAGNRQVVWGIHSVRLSGNASRATLVVRQLCALLSRVVPRAIVCVAQVSLRAHVRLGYQASRCVVIPNGFMLPDLAAVQAAAQAWRRDHGVDPSCRLVGFAGRFNPAKDAPNFVAAARRVAAARPEARFLMIGRGIDHDNQALRRLIDATGCADRFMLLGERRDVEVCLAAMDVFCLSSRTEAFPLVVGESMAVGTVCVATDVGDTAFLVGDTGRIVPPQEAPALADGLLQVLAMDAPQRRALGLAARQRIVDEFSMASACSRFAQLYEGILGRGPSAGEGRP